MASSASDNPVRTYHLFNGLTFATFVVPHIVNFVAGIFGPEIHISVMTAMRSVYQNRIVEALLLCVALLQVLTGLYLVFVRKAGKNSTGWPLWQRRSGLAVGVFLIIHTLSVLFARWWLRLDTNYYFSAAGLNIPLTIPIYGPYYFLSIFALSVHLGAAAWRYGFPNLASRLPIAGAAIASIVLLGMTNFFRGVHVPSRYYDRYFSYAMQPIK